VCLDCSDFSSLSIVFTIAFPFSFSRLPVSRVVLLTLSESEKSRAGKVAQGNKSRDILFFIIF
jgi:hypothetical protein